MTIDRSQVRVGMAVVGADAQGVGHVKEILDLAVLVDRPWHRDIYVPFHAIGRRGPTKSCWLSRPPPWMTWTGRNRRYRASRGEAWVTRAWHPHSRNSACLTTHGVRP